MHLLIAPDKLRGTYTASQAAEAIDSGWRSIRSTDSAVLMPLADGGEGTAEALCAAAATRPASRSACPIFRLIRWVRPPPGPGS